MKWVLHLATESHRSCLDVLSVLLFFGENKRVREEYLFQDLKLKIVLTRVKRRFDLF
jgi:hypothetical protein